MMLEKRMYFFVPYNLSPIQQGIQAGHSAVEYAREYRNDEEFIDFADNHKTWIILNGGTTNSKFDENHNRIGTLDQIAESLEANSIKYSIFIEPDLNDSLSAVCFIADERVFKLDDYPNLKDYLLQEEGILEDMSDEQLKEEYPEEYNKWETYIGGPGNVFLRQLLKGKKLA